MIKGKKEITLRFNKKIYSEKAIQNAIRLYSSFAKINSKDNQGYVNVKISKINSHFKDIIADEFANSVLILTKNINEY